MQLVARVEQSETRGGTPDLRKRNPGYSYVVLCEEQGHIYQASPRLLR